MREKTPPFEKLQNEQFIFSFLLHTTKTKKKNKDINEGFKNKLMLIKFIFMLSVI